MTLSTLCFFFHGLFKLAILFSLFEYVVSGLRLLCSLPASLSLARKRPRQLVGFRTLVRIMVLNARVSEPPVHALNPARLLELYN